MMRLLLVALLCSCVRSHAEVEASEDAAFLGEASGLYVLTREIDVATRRTNAELVPVFAVGDRLFLSFTLPEAPGFAFSIAAHQTEAGSFAAEVAVPGDEVEALKLDVGLDALSGKLAFGDVSLGLVLTKSCDFDARVSGVFETIVNRIAELGDCAGVADLSGNRRWAFSIANARENAAMLSFDGADVELGAQLSFSHDTREFSFENVSTFGRVREGITRLRGTVTIDGATTSLATDLEQTEGACTRVYQATSWRTSGTKAGIACQARTGPRCAFDLSMCPRLPLEWDADFEATLDGIESDPENACPESSCRARIPAMHICESSRRLALVGCPAGERLSYTEGACVSLSCVESECGRVLPSGSRFAPQNEVCGEGDFLVIDGAGTTCEDARCEGPNARCPTRPPPCETPLRTDHVDEEGCPVLVCDIAWEFTRDLQEKNYAAEELLARDAEAYAALKEALRSGYRISDATPGAFTTVPASFLSGCPAVELDLLSFACPDAGETAVRLDPYSGAAGQTDIFNNLVLYREDDGVLCLGLARSDTNEHISGFNDASHPFYGTCTDGEATTCAKAPVAETLYDSLSCLPATFPFWVRVRAGGPVTLTLDTDDAAPQQRVITTSIDDGYYLFPTRVTQGTGYTLTADMPGCALSPESGVIDGEVTATWDCR